MKFLSLSEVKQSISMPEAIDVTERAFMQLAQQKAILPSGSTEPLVHLQDLQAHAHINAIGAHNPSMQEISSETLQNAAVIVDQLEAVMKESGELIRAIEQKKLKKESIIELGSWLLKKTPAFQDQLTVLNQ